MYARSPGEVCSAFRDQRTTSQTSMCVSRVSQILFVRHPEHSDDPAGFSEKCLQSFRASSPRGSERFVQLIDSHFSQQFILFFQIYRILSFLRQQAGFQCFLVFV